MERQLAVLQLATVRPCWWRSLHSALPSVCVGFASPPRGRADAASVDSLSKWGSATTTRRSPSCCCQLCTLWYCTHTPSQAPHQCKQRAVCASHTTTTVMSLAPQRCNVNDAPYTRRCWCISDADHTRDTWTDTGRKRPWGGIRVWETLPRDAHSPADAREVM
jgi:hypothetical protein